MNWQLKVSLRYLTSTDRFVSLISLISVLGVAVGVGALIIVISVMSGFDDDLRDKIIGTYSHIEIISDSGMKPSAELAGAIMKAPHAAAVSFFLNGQGLVRSGEEAAGVIVKGVSARDEVRVNRLGEYVKKGSLELSGGGIVLGSELAGRLGVKVGDRVWLAAPGSGMLKGAGMPSGFRIDGKDFRVAGVFTSGMYEYDANLAYIDIADARELFAEGGPQGGAAVRVDNALKVDEAARALRAALGPQYAVRTWMDLNRSLIAALKLEKTVMFIILALIVAVACCNIASTLIMMVVEKTRDIGIFKTIGSTNMNVMAIFALQGGLIGAIGTAAGTAAGLAVCWWLKTYRLIGLPKEIYYIDKLPVKVDPYDVSLIITVSILLSLVLSIYPAYMASRLDPVEALRYE